MTDFYFIFSLMFLYVTVKSFRYVLISRQNRNYAFTNFFILLTISGTFASISSLLTFFYPDVISSMSTFLWVLVHLLFFGILLVSSSLYESIKNYHFNGVRFEHERDIGENVIPPVVNKSNTETIINDRFH